MSCAIVITPNPVSCFGGGFDGGLTGVSGRGSAGGATGSGGAGTALDRVGASSSAILPHATTPSATTTNGREPRSIFIGLSFYDTDASLFLSCRAEINAAGRRSGRG